MFSFSDKEILEYLETNSHLYLEEGDVPLEGHEVFGTGVEIKFVNDGDVGCLVVSRQAVEEDMEKLYA